MHGIWILTTKSYALQLLAFSIHANMQIVNEKIKYPPITHLKYKQITFILSLTVIQVYLPA